MSVKKSIAKACDCLGDVPVIGGLFKPKPKIAVLRMTGVITDLSARRQTISHAKFEKLIERAFDLHKLQAVALVINSPGGAPAQCQLMGNQIRRLAEEKDVPVYAFVEDVAASGGYWLACAGDEIYAQETSIVGSIGVISASFGFEDFIDRYEIKRRIHTSGKDKSFLDPFVPEKPGDIKRLKEIQGDIHETFINWVKLRRGDALNGTDKELFEGQFWAAETAQSYGLIDGLGDYREICQAKFGDDMKYVDLAPEKKWIPSFLGSNLTSRESLAQDALETIEEKAVWARFGL